VPSINASVGSPQGRFRLQAKGAYSFAASVRFLEGFAPAGQADSGGDEVQWTFLADDFKTVASVVLRDRTGDVDGEVFAGDPKLVRAQVARVLSLDVDGRGFEQVGERDPVVTRLQGLYPGLRPVLFFSPFEAALWALISQRIRIRQAAAIRARMAAELGATVTVRGTPASVVPAPARLRELDSFPGLSAVKIRYLHALADAAEDGALDADRLRARPPEQALEELKRLPGIGDFSAHLILLRGAGGPDYPPASEPRLQHAVALAYGTGEPSSQQLDALSEKWKPYRTWVTFLLRVHLETDSLRA
jgi:DNA-3-methyladenine glycosylase II